MDYFAGSGTSDEICSETDTGLSVGAEFNMNLPETYVKSDSDVRSRRC